MSVVKKGLPVAPVEAFGGALHAAEYVAAAYHDCYLCAGVDGSLDLLGILAEAHGVDAIVLGAHEGFAAELEEYSGVFLIHDFSSVLAKVILFTDYADF